MARRTDKDHRTQVELLNTVLSVCPAKVCPVVQFLPINYDLALQMFKKEGSSLPQILILIKRGAFKEAGSIILGSVQVFSSSTGLAQLAGRGIEGSLLELGFLLENLTTCTVKARDLVFFRDSFNQLLELLGHEDLPEEFAEVGSDMVMLFFQKAFESYKQNVFDLNQIRYISVEYSLLFSHLLYYWE